MEKVPRLTSWHTGLEYVAQRVSATEYAQSQAPHVSVQIPRIVHKYAHAHLVYELRATMLEIARLFEPERLSASLVAAHAKQPLTSPVPLFESCHRSTFAYGHPVYLP